jgi:hypothetical protein
MAQVRGKECHLIGSGDQDPLRSGDRLDRAVDFRARDAARGVFDVDVVGRDGLFERGLVEAEERRRQLRRLRCPVVVAVLLASWSSGKPSKPSAWLKRTTVDDEVFARRASSSAVWKATSSR